MAEATDFLPSGGMVNIGNAKEPWKEIHAEQINTAEVNTDKVMNLSVVGGKLCMTYNK